VTKHAINSRIIDCLESSGFWHYTVAPAFTSERIDRIWHVRLSTTSLFQRIQIDRGRDFIAIDYGVSVVPGRSCSFDTTRQERDYSQQLQQVVKGRSIEQWVPDVCEIAITHCARMDAEHASDLLLKTQRGRKAAAFYLSKINTPIANITCFRDSLLDSCDEEIQTGARQALDPGMFRARSKSYEDDAEGMAVYQTASLLISQHADEHGAFFVRGHGEDDDADIPICIQIMASFFFDERGCRQIMLD